jgi:hypothetical protein
MQKRGQVTLFIIIAIVLVTSAVIWFFFFKGVGGGGFPSGAEEISSHVQRCVDQSLDQAIFLVGQQGLSLIHI